MPFGSGVFSTAEDLPQLWREVGAYLDWDDAFDLFPLGCREPQRRIRWQHAPPGRETVGLL